MVLQFSRIYQKGILDGSKTQTIRAWSKRLAKPGSFHWAQSGYRLSDRFARLHITSVVHIPMMEITDKMARRDGFAGLVDLKEQWIARHGAWDPGRQVYVVAFDVVTEVEEAMIKGQGTAPLVATMKDTQQPYADDTEVGWSFCEGCMSTRRISRFSGLDPRNREKTKQQTLNTTCATCNTTAGLKFTSMLFSEAREEAQELGITWFWPFPPSMQGLA